MYLSARIYNFNVRYDNDEMQVVEEGAVNNERSSSSIMQL